MVVYFKIPYVLSRGGSKQYRTLLGGSRCWYVWQTGIWSGTFQTV